MRAAERDVLLFLLATGSGAADGWSYMALGHAFVANMTGNTVLLGLAVLARKGDFLHPLISLACYAAGTALAATIARRPGGNGAWGRGISWTLLLEAIILTAAATGWATLRTGAVHPFSTNLLLGAAAFSVGLQSGAMLQLRIPGIVTTYITGTWTTLVSGVVTLASGGAKERTGRRIEFEERLLVQGGILCVYFLSAVLTGWLFGHHPASLGALPAGCVLVVAVWGLMRG